MNRQLVGTVIQTYVVRLLNKESYNWLEKMVLLGLWILSLIYGLGVHLRKAFYKLKIFKSYVAPLPTICVGNITSGGSGKTPTVLKLATILQKRYKVAIVSKGYKGNQVKKTKVHQLIATDSANDFGDEPVMMKRAHPELSVFVCKNRRFALEQLASLDFDMAILDDGFQDLSLKADVNIAMFNDLRAVRKKHLLPRGFLREGVSSLKRAHFIGMTEKESNNPKSLVSQLKKTPVFYLTRTYSGLKGSSALKIEELQSTKIGVFSAIANPKNFEKALKKLGADIVEDLTLKDHSAFETSQLEKLGKKALAKGATYLICTYKDYVKIPQNLRIELPIYYLDYSLKALPDEQDFTKLLKTIESRIESYHRKRETSL